MKTPATMATTKLSGRPKIVPAPRLSQVGVGTGETAATTAYAAKKFDDGAQHDQRHERGEECT